jgi:hypothetical protein
MPTAPANQRKASAANTALQETGEQIPLRAYGQTAPIFAKHLLDGLKSAPHCRREFISHDSQMGCVGCNPF